MLRAESEGRPQVAGSRIADTFLGFFASLALGSFAFNAPGQSGTDFALSFNGTSDFVTVPNNPVLELTSGTIELWFYPDWVPGSLAYDPVLVGNQQGPALTRYSIQVDRNLTGVTLANGISSSKVAYPFTRGQWYHLALVSSNSTAQVFVNGLPAGNTSNGFGTVIGLSLQLGSDGVGGFFRGQMDEVRIWNTPRGAADLRYNVSRALTGNEPGLIAYWRMDEGVGLTAADATTNGFDGAVNGAAWTNSDVVLVNTSGSFGTALDFSSSRGSYVQVPPAPSLALSNQFTFEAWIKPRTAQCNTILARGDGLNLTNTDFIFQVGNDGTNCGLMKVALMVTGAWTASASTVPLNAWTHVAVTYDGLTNRFFINGLLDGAVAANGNAIYQSGSALFIGRQGVSGNNYFDGTLDEVRVWNTVRSPAQIQTNLSRVLPPNEPGMIGYWRFNEQAGIRAFDSSGLGNHGTESRRPMRVGSFWVPVLTPIGPNPTQQECHIVFADLGASGTGTGIALDTGYSHALLVDPDGTVRGWGAVGANDGQATIPPVATNIVSVGTGFYHSLALKADGTVLGWGYNNDGEVNIPRAATNVIAIGAGAYYNVALKSDGTILAWGRNVSGETNVPPSATNIVAVAAGDEHVVALRADGAVISWGRSNLGQTNVPPGAINAIDVAAGGQFSFAMRNDGTLIGWGANDFGELSAPPAASGSTAISLGDGQVLAVKPGGTALGWGRNDYGQGNIPASRTNVTLIAAGEVHSLAVVSDGAVLAWGYNQYGAANVPAAVNQLSLPVLIRGMVNTNTPGVYVRTYTMANGAGGLAVATRRVVVTDSAPPVLALLGSNPLNIDVGSPFVDPGATAIDACAGDLTAGIVQTGTVNVLVPGRYTVTYSVSDPSGNTSTTNRTVLVTGRPAILGFRAFSSGTNPVTGSPVVQFLADVNPNGLATMAFAQYGLTTAYPGRTTSVSLPASYDTSSFFATLDGLIPGATYHFRVVATNSLGAIYGSDQTFAVPLIFEAGDINGDGRVDQAELSEVLSNYWRSNPGPIITNPASLGSGRFQFALTNADAWAFSILVSTNLVDWEVLPTSAVPVWQFLDPFSTNRSDGFYRLRWP